MLKIKLRLICLCLCFVHASQARTWYVKSSSLAGQNGRTWATAFRYFQIAIDSAIVGDTIKVATGTYYGYEPTIAKSRFGIRSGAIILGGYPATGAPIDTDRNPSLYPVVMTGEAGSSSVVDNVYHLIEGYNLAATTVLDGFIIEKAANYNSTTVYNSFGAGMHLFNSSGTFKNLVFRKNYASNGGSAICVYGTSNPQFVNCIITENFNNNGGVMHFTNGATVRMTNCLIARNQSGNYQPSAIFYCNQVNFQLINNTVVNNNIEGDTLNKPAAIVADNNSSLTIANSIFYHNQVYEYNGYVYGEQRYDSSEIRMNSGTTNIAFSLVENYAGGSDMYRGVEPRFLDTASVIGADGKYFTADDGYTLRNPCSPALNAGNNAAIGAINTDITGASRIFSGGVIDLGPYESQATPTARPGVLYVNKLATGANNGTSWQNAYVSLQSALMDCGDTIKIAAGTYLPSTTSNLIPFVLQKRMIWLGGYPSVGSPTDAERDPILNATILDGMLPSTEQAMVIVSAKYVDSTSVLDGVQIARAGYAGLKLNNRAKPILRNVVFNNNARSVVASKAGGAKFIGCKFNSADQNAIWMRDSSIIQLLNAVVTGAGARAIIAETNSVLNADSTQFMRNITDGALLMEGGATGIFNDCSFLGNYGTDGKDVALINTTAQFNNCLFADSTTGYNRYGGSIYMMNAQPVFEGCSFIKHYSNNGGVVYGSGAVPIFRRCLFDGNISGNGGVFLLENQSNLRLYNCVAVRNQSDAGSFLRNINSTAQINNCSIVRQQSNNLPYAAVNVIYNSDNASTQIRNSILWANNTGYNANFTEIVNVSGAQTTAFNSFFQQFGTNGLNGNRVGVNPRMRSPHNPAGLDGLFFTTDDGLQLKTCSPAANRGSNSYVENGLPDLLGQNRVFNNVVDMGAYELQETADSSLSKTIFVRKNATGTATGSSWQDAYTSLQDALANSCADTIKVAAGVYFPASASRDSSFLILDAKTIWGGYPNTGNPSDALRDGEANPTILDGNIGNSSDSSDNVKHVVYVRYAAGPVELRHLTIRNGYANGGNNDATGSGIWSLSSLLHVDSCRITRNLGAFRGGGVQASGGWVQLNRCIIDSNAASRDGGGVNFTGLQTGSNIQQSVIWRNVSQMGAGLSFNSAAKVYNTLLLENRASIKGGGVYVDAQQVNLVNCVFYANSSRDNYGGGYYCDQPAYSQASTNALNNCIFYGNTTLGGAYLGSDLYDANCGFDNYCYTGVQVNNCLTQDHPSALNGNPLFADLSNYKGADGKWFTADDGLQLTECSACINAGNSAYANADSTDFNGLPRKRLGKVDVGAYEYQQPISGKVEITPMATGSIYYVGDTIRLKVNGANYYAWEAGYFEADSNLARYVLTDTGTRTFTVVGYNQPNCTMKADTAQWTVRIFPQPFCNSQGFQLNCGYYQPYYLFHWEADTGNGYHALQDGAVFNHVTTQTMQVLQPDLIKYGTRFRCLITQDPQPAFYGIEHTIRFANTFVGGVDNSWENPDNWSCYAVPTSQTDVFVPATASSLQVSSVVRCHSISIQANAQVSILAGGAIIVEH